MVFPNNTYFVKLDDQEVKGNLVEEWDFYGPAYFLNEGYK
jgi:hypothetical protein